MKREREIMNNSRQVKMVIDILKGLVFHHEVDKASKDKYFDILNALHDLYDMLPSDYSMGIDEACGCYECKVVNGVTQMKKMNSDFWGDTYNIIYAGEDGNIVYIDENEIKHD